MVDAELAILQKELDDKKYFQSNTARQDLAGRMEYCNGCSFNVFDIEKQHMICNLDHQSRTENCVCAKSKVRNIKSMSK